MTVTYSFFADSKLIRSANAFGSISVATPVILFASRGGTAREIAMTLSGVLDCPTPVSLTDFQFDGIFNTRQLVIVVASDAGGRPVPDGLLFFKLLEDLEQDFRVSRDTLSKLQVAVVGVGSIEYGIDNFCVAARTMHTWFERLGAQSACEALLITDSEGLGPQIDLCTKKVRMGFSQPSKKWENRYLLAWTGASRAAVEEADLSDSASDYSADELALEDAEGCGSSEMLTARQRKQLEKEGYKIIGSHSAVKLCRWTKHGVRGRGLCYKRTFYGIDSSSCMEATPSLACANKCVFCWRHHKNPVGTSWKWKTDPADEIVSEAVRLHTNLIKELKGVPGVTEERHAAAMNVKHCALSLVGEPIMYPQINELLSELHKRRISTFLVTNAQFPEAIRNLSPVTQLYVSVDAATPETLKKTDRPLFADFWERYIECFKAIREKKQRTIYRLTLVKEYNMAEDEAILNEYANLVKIGEPDFIEIKAVTFCGSSQDKDALTMQNVPWHDEVVKLSTALTQVLAKRGIGKYALASEHKHSCSILIAEERYRVDGAWHTWIDYGKYADLALSGRTDFTAEEYWAPTPEWAVYGADEKGFDPQQVRHHHRASKVAKALKQAAPQGVSE